MKSPPITDLTLRDFFAAQIAGSIWRDMPADTASGACAFAVAQKAYMVADEMLRERDRDIPLWAER